MSNIEGNSQAAEPLPHAAAGSKGAATDGSYWSASAPAAEFPRLSGDIQVDVAIIVAVS